MNKKERLQLQKEIVDSLSTSPHGILNLSPRIGKTKIIIDLIKRDCPKSILWVTPSRQLADEDIPNEFITWKAKRFISKLTTTTYSSLAKTSGLFDLIILDECQHLTEGNSEALFTTSLNYRSIIAMTGTPTKHFNKQELYSKLKLEVLYDLSINEAVDSGLLPDYDMTVLRIPLDTRPNVKGGSKARPFMTSEFKSYQYWTREVEKAKASFSNKTKYKIMARMRMIKDSHSKLNVAKKLFDTLQGRVLLFAGTIKHAEAISNHTYHSKTDNEDLLKFQANEIQKIAMVNAGGTGFTYKAIDHLILVQADSDKNGFSSQKIC